MKRSKSLSKPLDSRDHRRRAVINAVPFGLAYALIAAVTGDPAWLAGTAAVVVYGIAYWRFGGRGSLYPPSESGIQWARRRLRR